jgi:hypothetical protein
LLVNLQNRSRTSCEVDESVLIADFAIAGKEIVRDELGRMLMSFEGWQFKMVMADKSEEL